MTQRVRADRPIGRMNLDPSPPKVKPALSKQGQPVLAKKGQKPHLCQVRIDRKLLDTIRNAVQAAKMGGNFHYGNASDFIRSALTDYKNGMKLVETSSSIDRQVHETTLRMDDALYIFWCSLPYGCRCEILERALWTKMRQAQ